MDKSDRIAKRIIAVNMRTREATYDLWRLLFAKEISGMMLPDSIASSGWVKHHFEGPKEYVDDNSSRITTQTVNDLYNLVDDQRNNIKNCSDLRIYLTNENLEKEEKFIEELSRIVYIPARYHSLMDKEQGIHNISEAYKRLRQIMENEKSISDFSNIKEAIESLKIVSSLFKTNEFPNEILIRLKEIFYDLVNLLIEK